MIDSIFYSQTEDVLDDVEIMSSISRESDERLGKFELKKKMLLTIYGRGLTILQKKIKNVLIIACINLNYLIT